MKNHYDILILGSGIVGATAALALAKNTAYKIALIDAQRLSSGWQPNTLEQRVSAITLSSQRIFQRLDIWDAIQAKRSSPFEHMHVWDEAGNGEIHFSCAEVNEPVLGYIIENQVMHSSLMEKITRQNNIDLITNTQFATLTQQTNYVTLQTANTDIFTTRLLIAADGANSWVRTQTSNSLKTKDYAQTAIVATVKTELPHAKTAWQRFLTSGPLAFLPLADPHYCSIVWSTTPSAAQELLALEDNAFCARLSAAFAHKLGQVLTTSRRLSFPLQMQHAENYVLERIAFIGDAAHTVHPLAGQGINLGLLDAACLAEVILTAAAKQRDFTHLTVLKRYARWRKAENLTMLTGVDCLKYLFSHPHKIVQSLRNAGLQITQRLPLLKNFLIHYALGNERNLPELAKPRKEGCS